MNDAMLKMLQSLETVDIFLLCVIIFYLYCCPYTKVEESFNLQAIHDILEYGLNIDQYDHLQFPGVVPRTFIGALGVAVVSFPAYIIFSIMDFSGVHKQMLCRGALGLIVWSSFAWFRSSIEKVFGKRTSQLYVILTMLQFHSCFYATRTLPNVFAMAICLWSFGYWLRGKCLYSILLIAMAAVIFRCDMLVLLAPTVLVMLLNKEIPFWSSFFAGIGVTGISLLLSFSIDSFFWQRALWPEGVVLFFNTVENKSSEWGIMPFHWYFTNAIPKSLHITLAWILVGIVGLKYRDPICGTNDSFIKVFMSSIQINRHPHVKKAMYYCLPTLCFIVLYSFLPHKELRFIMPALPTLTLLGACGLNALFPHTVSDLWYPLCELADDSSAQEADYKKHDGDSDKDTNKDSPAIKIKSSLYMHLFSFGVATSFIIMAMIANTLLGASFYNYPGGMALDRLLTQHVPLRLVGESDLHNIDRPLFVHIDTLAATSGVSRFLQERYPVSVVEPKNNYYLNTSPSEWQQLLPGFQCDNKAWGECGGDAVYYSKHENLTDFSGFDWVITEDSKFSSKHKGFFAIEKINAFNRVIFGRNLIPQIHLKGTLYIFQNTVDSE